MVMKGLRGELQCIGEPQVNVEFWSPPHQFLMRNSDKSVKPVSYVKAKLNCVLEV